MPSEYLLSNLKALSRNFPDTLQILSRHLVDTIQTPYNHLLYTFRTSYGHLPDNFLPPVRHIPDNFHTLIKAPVYITHRWVDGRFGTCHFAAQLERTFKPSSQVDFQVSPKYGNN